MCGLCGELRFDGVAPDRGALDRMCAALVARGPDDGGSWREGAVALGHQRLSIIDLTAQARQPMRDEALGLTLVFNGTIYNYLSLRAELLERGYVFFSESDSEVILKAYHAWGLEALSRLDGMFAFALWDSNARRLVLARDRFGIKPLYFSQDARRFRFASSLPALLAGGGLSGALDSTALQFQFTLHGSVPAPWTILRDARKLLPASVLVIEENGRAREQVYWRLDARRPEEGEPEEEERIAAVRKALDAAVRSHRAAADVPVGVLLSGGLDSSLLVALLAAQGEREIRTFSIGFADQPEESGNEFLYSDLVARHFGARHRRYLMSDRDLLEHLPQVFSAMSEPMFSQDNVAFYLLAREVRQEVKVALSGQGADEVFGGYYWYPRILAEDERLPMAERVARHYFDRSYADYLDLFSAEFRAQSQRDMVTPFIQKGLEAPGADTFADQVLRLDATTLIVDDPVKRIDNMTMAHGLEARVPFLDRTLVETAMRLDPLFRLRENGKYPLKKIARALLPAGIIDRPKGYFPTPVLKYLRGGALEYVRDLLESSACRARGLYNREKMARMLSAPMSDFTPLEGNSLWHLAALEGWLEAHDL